MGDSQPRRLEELLAREGGLILLMFSLALLQVTLLQVPPGFSLPLLPVLVICRTLIGIGSAFPDRGVSAAMRWALYGGLALDVLASTRLGSHALAMLLAAVLIAGSTRRLRVDRPIFPLLGVLIGVTLSEACLALLRTPPPDDWLIYGQVVILPTVLIALIPTLPLFFGLRWLLRNQL